MNKTTYVDLFSFEPSNFCLFSNRDIHSRIGYLLVKAFDKNGIATICPKVGWFIHDFAEVVVGCFNEDSNFGTELLKAYNYDENVHFNGIKFEFNKMATIKVTKANADIDTICKEYQVKKEAYHKKKQQEREAWLKTPDGLEYLKHQQEKEAQKKALEAKVFQIDETIEMEFKDAESKSLWDEMVRINSNDKYGMSIINFARRSAKYMQKFISEGKAVSEVAEKAFHDCNLEDITFFMYDNALRDLSRYWKYGEELKIWLLRK